MGGTLKNGTSEFKDGFLVTSVRNSRGTHRTQSQAMLTSGVNIWIRTKSWKEGGWRAVRPSLHHNRDRHSWSSGITGVGRVRRTRCPRDVPCTMFVFTGASSVHLCGRTPSEDRRPSTASCGTRAGSTVSCAFWKPQRERVD